MRAIRVIGCVTFWFNLISDVIDHDNESTTLLLVTKDIIWFHFYVF